MDTKGWYTSTTGASPSSPGEDVLSAAFAEAKSLLRKLLPPADFDTLFPPSPSPSTTEDSLSHVQHTPSVSSHTISDVHRCLRDAQTAYETRIGHHHTSGGLSFQTTVASPSTSSTNARAVPRTSGAAKARLWFTDLSEKLLYYGNIFDVLAQHHPEYVALAWGTLKFLLVAVTNHATTASKLSESISHIADLLPQHAFHLILYPTREMQTAVARLYACILEFFLSALQWYRDSRAAHAFKSIFQPWDIRFRGEYEAVAATAQQVGRLADVALKAEVRDIRSEVVRGREDWESVRREMSELRKENQCMQKLILCMHQEIRLDLASQRITLSRVHLNQMLTLPLWDSFPTSGESLQFCRSIRKRRGERTRLPLPDVRKLEAWSLRGDNALLLIDTYSSFVAKTFMIDLIDLILRSHLPIIWALRYANYRDRPMSVTDIARTLVLQTLQAGADRLLDSPFPVTVEQLRGAASIDEWIEILNHLLSSLNHAFIVLDADLLTHATAYERGQVLEMLDLLRSKLLGNVKIVTSTSCVGPSYVKELEDLDACIRVQTGNACDWRKTGRQRRPVMRFRKW